MPLLMTDIEVRLPDRKRASSSFSSKKPMAEVSCIMEKGCSREIVVPVRVGRILMGDAISLPLPEDEAFDAIHALEGRICFNLMTEMLSRRDYAAGELREKLRLYGYRDEEIDPCLDRARDLRFVNDARFASYFIEERKRRGWGRIKIERELKMRGVSLDDIPDYPDAYFSEDEDLERAVALLGRKRVPESRPYEKLVRHLMSKGFAYSVAAEAARRRLAEDDITDF